MALPLPRDEFSTKAYIARTKLSKLFGHEKGAFTGATHAKSGLIEIASGGTVFFDEIADVPLSMQVKLLRLLETHCYRTVGGLKQRKANFRLICASHKNLLDLVESGQFRKDLYYRIAGFPISLPSLAERSEDIKGLILHFLSHSELRHKKFSSAALKRLSEYDYPGNIRELKSIVEQATLLANEDLIEVHDLPEQIFARPAKPQISDSEILSLEEAEERYLTEVCESQNMSIDERREILNKKWLDILNKVYEEEGILSAIRAYYNKKDMKVESASLRILTDEDVSPLQFLRDCKTVPKHTNLHTDPLEGYMTSIIYLSDVKEGEGGTQFFPKSHRYMYDDLQEIFARSVSTGNYCFNEYSRAVLFRLPKFLRVTKNWGRLVEKGSKMEKYLDRNMVHFISKKKY